MVGSHETGRLLVLQKLLLLQRDCFVCGVCPSVGEITETPMQRRSRIYFWQPRTDSAEVRNDIGLFAVFVKDHQDLLQMAS